MNREKDLEYFFASDSAESIALQRFSLISKW